MTKEVEVGEGLNGEAADMLFVVLGCLLKRQGGYVHISVKEIKDLKGGFTTDAGPDGVTLTYEEKMPEGVVVQ